MKQIPSTTWFATHIVQIIPFNTRDARSLFNNKIKEAEFRHKQEIKAAYLEGLKNENKSAEEYYNETFETL